MRELRAEQVELIDAAIAEGMAGHLSAAVLEKDIHVSDSLKALFELNHDKTHLVFCGGTSLSKAHHIIERMSEDIDLKVVLTDNHGLSRSGLRSHLSTLKSKVAEVLTTLGFEESEDERTSRNENRYFGSSWSYHSKYETDISLRSCLKLELTTRTPQFATVEKPIEYLVDRLIGRSASVFSLKCVAVEETLSEKVVSFLRRYAQYRAGKMCQDWDSALVRHVYDTYCICQQDHDAIVRAKKHFKALVDYDVGEFGNQYKEFEVDPGKVLRVALDAAEKDPQTQEEYMRHLLPLVFGHVKPDYQTAYREFRACAETLLPLL